MAHKKKTIKLSLRQPTKPLTLQASQEPQDDAAEKSAAILQHDEKVKTQRTEKTKVLLSLRRKLEDDPRTKAQKEIAQLEYPKGLKDNLPESITKIGKPRLINGDYIPAGMPDDFEAFNDKQRLAIQWGAEGKSFCLIGGAGTGKTTTQHGLCLALQDSGKIFPRRTSTKHLPLRAPSVLICSFTNKAVNNIRDKVPNEFKPCCITIHKALEYAPEKYTVEDPETGLDVLKTRFAPQRTAENPIDDISICIIEEGSSVGTGLTLQLMDALPPNVVFIFLGDLNQLPPVMDDAILGFALNHLPVIELTHVYRQALESPIISFAYRILESKPLDNAAIDKIAEEADSNKLRFMAYKGTSEPAQEMVNLGESFKNAVIAGKFDPENSVVLCPFNTGGKVNSDQLNRWIAQGFSEVTNNPVFEIIAGFNTLYYSVDDIIFAGKELWRITDIVPNVDYSGKPPQLSSTALDRWGRINHEKLDATTLLDADHDWEKMDWNVENFMDREEDDEEARKQAASHICKLQNISDPDMTKELITKGDYNDSQLGYAMTIHKSQGSEWRKVYLVLHNSHAKHVNREMLYTGITRAREELVIIYRRRCKAINRLNKTYTIKGTFEVGIMNQAIKGRTLEDKLAYFQHKEKMNKEIIELEAKVRAREKVDDIGDYDYHYSQLWRDSKIRRIIEVLDNLNPDNPTINEEKQHG